MPPKLPKMRYVKFTRAKGKLYAYFCTGRYVNGKEVRCRLPEFGTAEFHASYGSYLGARTKATKKVPTIASVADLYQKSDRWKRLAEGTRKIYTITLKRVLDEFGDFPLFDVTRADILAALDDIPGPATRNLFVAMMGNIFTYARYRDLTDADPVKGIETFATGTHEPWSEALLQAALSCDDATVRLATHLLYFTGQRIGDVCKMRWSDIAGPFLHVTQKKTGKVLRIHQHSRLMQELANTPRLGMTILAKPNGKPWSQDTILGKLQAFARKQGEGRIVAHGLRKNAVIALLEAGATIPEVQAVTGQSVEMVMHYAAKVDQGRLSEAAILKLERRK